MFSILTALDVQGGFFLYQFQPIINGLRKVTLCFDEVSTQVSSEIILAAVAAITCGLGNPNIS
jgi:hypothetical protein